MTTPKYSDIARTDVLALAPGLSKIDQSAWLDILAYVNELDDRTIGGGVDGATVRLARLYLAAHLGQVTLNARGGAAGPVTSESAGALRRSYGFLNTAAARQGLASTMFGQQYLSIIEQTPARAWILL